MVNPHELLGQKEVALAEASNALARANEEYKRLWEVIKAVKDGTIGIEQVELSLDAETGGCGWKINEKLNDDDDPKTY